VKHIREKRLNGVVVLTPKGNLVGGDETDELQAALKSLAEQKVPCVVIDLKDAEFITSMALGILVAAHTSYTNRNLRIALCNLTKRIWNTLVIARLSLTFDVYENEQKAVTGCAAGRLSAPPQ
jgi:anti-anti-sigma factor